MRRPRDGAVPTREPTTTAPPSRCDPEPRALWVEVCPAHAQRLSANAGVRRGRSRDTAGPERRATPNGAPTTMIDNSAARTRTRPGRGSTGDRSAERRRRRTPAKKVRDRAGSPPPTTTDEPSGVQRPGSGQALRDQCWSTRMGSSPAVATVRRSGQETGSPAPQARESGFRRSERKCDPDLTLKDIGA